MDVATARQSYIARFLIGHSMTFLSKAMPFGTNVIYVHLSPNHPVASHNSVAGGGEGGLKYRAPGAQKKNSGGSV